VTKRFEQQEIMLKALAEANFKIRYTLKRNKNKKINVLFACNIPAEWSMFDSIYNKIVDDPEFNATVVALPYRHNSLPEGQYKDEDVVGFLQSKGVNVIPGYNREKDEWLNPASLDPDYIFFQSPYNLFSATWSVEYVSMIAKVCYIPYGTCLFSGKVDNIVHPSSFFSFTSKFFIESPLCQELFLDKFSHHTWFNTSTVVLSGHPKLDYLSEQVQPSGKAWRRGVQQDIKRILWTPRWNTSEGNCHFFDYKDYFVDFCSKHHNVDFIFRPHPLCLQNFIKTGELSASKLEQMESKYKKSSNMALDRTGEYQDTFLTSDILISDISSMLLEYFATGKPIIYTHRINVFNELGNKLSEGFYWVRNSIELTETLEMLLSGTDPLKEKREGLIKSILFLPDGGAGLKIKEAIRSDYYAL
jgi:hypothetical protein